MAALPEGAKQADVIELYLPESRQRLDRFSNYSFDSNFMEPTDAWHLTIGGLENPSESIVEALVSGATVQLLINGSPQATGYIDSVVPHGSRGGGKVLEITGADTFAPVVRGGADPFNADLRFTADQTFEDMVRNVFGTYGFTKFAIDDAADRAVKTGLRAQRFTKKKGKPLKNFTFPQQLKPQPGESSWQYVSKIGERMGLYIWPSADGQTCIVSTPDYLQAPVARLVRQIGTNVSNIVDGGIGCHVAHQPSCIVATGFAGGGEWSRSKLKVIQVNELVGLKELTSAYNQWIRLSDEVTQVIENNQDAIIVAIRDAVFPNSLARPTKHAQPIFLHDEDSKSLEQLANFVRRRMSSFQKEMWVGEYTVYGHTYFDGQNYIPWTVNTIVDVDDEISGFRGPMWVCGRTFTKDAKTGGTLTHLHLTLPHTIEFFDYPPQAATAAKALPASSTGYLDPTVEWVTVPVDGDGRGTVLLNNEFQDPTNQAVIDFLAQNPDFASKT
jgi:prophage tail gpP-like protein